MSVHRRKIEDLKRSADLSQQLLIDKVVGIFGASDEELAKRETEVDKEGRWLRYLADQMESAIRGYLQDYEMPRVFGPHFIDRCRERFPG